MSEPDPFLPFRPSGHEVGTLHPRWTRKGWHAECRGRGPQILRDYDTEGLPTSGAARDLLKLHRRAVVYLPDGPLQRHYLFPKVVQREPGVGRGPGEVAT